jgi:hypothetical protein
MSNVSITDALRSERYDLNSDYAALDRRLFRAVGPERQSALRTTLNITDEGQRLEALYAFPRTAREAHLLFSHDRARILDSFHWVLSRAPFAGPIVDLGCGSGTLLRILREKVVSMPLVGVERAPNLVAIGRELSRGQPNIEIVEGSYDTAEPAHAPFRTLISICGLEFLNQPSVTIEEEHASADGAVPIPVQTWIAGQCGAALMHWRKIAHDEARLILVARLATVASIGAFITAAARSGWKLDFEASSRRPIGGEWLPAMVFLAAQAHEPEPLNYLATWLID